MGFRSNCLHRFRALAALAVVVALGSAVSPALAEDQPQQQPPEQQQRLSDQQVQQLVAPVALYPDPLLAQIFTASTYPLEVVMAARWSKDNPNLKGKDLENAMQQQPWDPSVKGLTAVPQVLAMMNDKLDWTQQLGEAFLAQPEDMTKAVQTLRAKAESTGNLKTTKEQKVIRQPPPPGYAGGGPDVVYAIEPVEPDVIYVPIYDPVVIFGVGYWGPAYVPFFWYPPWWTVGPVWGFWPAYYVGPALWCHYNWGFGYVQVNVVQFNRFNHTHIASAGGMANWQHDPKHHMGPYKNALAQQKYGNASGHNLKRNVNYNLKQGGNPNLKPNTNLNPKNTHLNTGNKNIGNKNLHTNLNTGTGNKYKSGGPGNTRNLHTNLNTRNKNFNTGNQNRINRVNQPKINQPKFSNTQNLNRNVQTFHGPTGGGGGGGNRNVGGGPPPKHH